MEQLSLGSTLTNVLGEARAITRTYQDGSFDCPFCGAAVLHPAPRCSNPWCAACDYAMTNPERTRPAFQAQADKARRQQEDDARRKRDYETRMAYIRETNAAHEQWIADTMAEARKLGACLRCVVAPGWERAKFIKHRGQCPKEAKS